jgi:uncharacterized protein (DUF58 family)
LLLSRHQPLSSSRRFVRRLSAAEAEFYGVREFRAGDSPRWIHWRTTARMGEPMVREFEEPPHDNLVLIVEPWLPRPAEELRTRLQQVRQENRDIIEHLLASGPPPPLAKRRAKEASLARKEEPFRQPLDTLELAISLAATICWEWHRQGGAYLALACASPTAQVHVAQTGTSQVWPFLESLALLEGTPQVEPATLLDHLAQTYLPPGPVLLVSTRSTGLADILANALRRPVVSLDVTDPLVKELFEERTADPPAGQREERDQVAVR